MRKLSDKMCTAPLQELESHFYPSFKKAIRSIEYSCTPEIFQFFNPLSNYAYKYYRWKNGINFIF